jgi:hypothetical protein
MNASILVFPIIIFLILIPLRARLTIIFFL